MWEKRVTELGILDLAHKTVRNSDINGRKDFLGRGGRGF
jgi:hypothetical protein